MPHGRKKAEHRGREETAEHGTSSSPEPDTFLAGASSHLTHAHPSPDQQHSPMDFYAFLTYMKERDDAARVEREEEAARYRAELAEQKREDAARFEALLSRLAPPPASSPAPTPGHPPSVSSHPPQAPEAWIKHGILTGVSDEELVQKIVALDASSTLLDVVTLCRAYEATRSAATAIRASPAARAVSQYKKGKKATHKSKAESQRVAPTSSSPCSACGKQQHGPKGCPSAAAICSGCGKTGHWSHTEKCPARNVQCNSCNRYGHFEKLCKSSTPKTSQRPAKPNNLKPAGDNRSTFHVVRAQTPHHIPRALEDQAGSIRRVQSSARGRPTPSPTITVVVTRGGVSGSIEVIPDTGADTTVIGPQHLRDLGLAKQELDPPPSLRYYNADGSRMPAALGSFQAKLTYGTRSCTGWIDVQGSLSTPLLSWEHCRALAIVPSDFPRQIKTSKTTVNRVEESPDVQPVEASRGVSKPTQEDNILDAETNFSVRSVVTLHAIESLASEDAQASPDQAVTRDLTLEGLRRATLDDPTYSDLLHFVKEGFPTHNPTLTPASPWFLQQREVFHAPFFTSWFCTTWTGLFCPSCLACHFCFRRDKDSLKVSLKTIAQNFRGPRRHFHLTNHHHHHHHHHHHEYLPQLTTPLPLSTPGKFMTRCCLFCMLWLVTDYMHVYSLRILDCTDVMALYSAHVSFVFLLSWMILHDQFVGVRVSRLTGREGVDGRLWYVMWSVLLLCCVWKLLVLVFSVSWSDCCWCIMS
ncbi:hypothetical protein O3P69_019099 [Scylla paramamosain]|uniref:CCHC-type domain-containing protein n=1 Tax=Scylla paramamosain TaxID=85552 RepID=A0AAW0SAS3_SCYPA